MFEEMAKERQRERKGDQAGSTVANLPQLEESKSRAKAAKAVNVGERIVQDAQFVRDHAPEWDNFTFRYFTLRGDHDRPPIEPNYATPARPPASRATPAPRPSNGAVFFKITLTTFKMCL